MSIWNRTAADHFSSWRGRLALIAIALVLGVDANSSAATLQGGSTPPEEYCPKICQAQPTVYDSGTPPFVCVISAMNPQSGTGTFFCATCNACKSGVSVAFTGYGTYCGSYTVNGSTPPVVPPDPTNWARNGFASSTCDDTEPDHIDVSITDCVTGQPVSTMGLYLYCPCQI